MAATLQQLQPVPPGAPGADPPGPPARPPSRLDRLRTPALADPGLSWVGTAVVTLLAAAVRLWGIGFPPAKQFDELYYATEGADMLRQGYEDNPGYMFIVHPPLGKWFIAAGMAVLGDGPVGWRVPAAVAGSLTVLLLIRIVRRMTGSTLLGCVAGLLLAADGLSVVLSRFALLDIFLALLVVAGFGCLVVDRDRVRLRLAAAVSGAEAAGARLDVPPRLGARPWRLAGGVLLGLSCGVKWSGVWFLAGFGLLSLVWDLGAMRSAGVRRPLVGAVARSLPGAAGSLGLAPVAAYLASWSGWFLGENPYGRHWAETHAGYGWSWVPGPLRSLLRYHAEMLHFHDGLSSYHPYQSGPWSWLVTGRPVLFYYPSNPSPTGCGAASCVRSVLAVGTPALWWAFVPAVLWMAWWVLSRRDWRAWVVLVALAAGWLSWFSTPGRTMFLFYMAPLVPFLVIGVTLALGDVLGRVRATETRRLVGLLGVSCYVALVVLDFGWLWPILTGQLVSYDGWHARIWFQSWI